MIPLYTAGRQLTKVRALMLLSIACLLGGAWWWWSSAPIPCGDSSDGPAALIMIAFGAAFAAGMWVYGRCYAAHIDFEPTRRQLHVRTVRFWGSTLRLVDVSDIQGYQVHDGRVYVRDVVDAPWVSVRLRGRRLPLLIDAQGKVLDPKLMRAFFGWSGSRDEFGHLDDRDDRDAPVPPRGRATRPDARTSASIPSTGRRARVGRSDPEPRR
jgi:hypothetical protein